jgi:hypothetical protein
MLAGFLGKLTSQAIRGLARNLFSGFYERGISANQALRELQAEGLGYRRQDFLNDFRQGESRYAQETKVKFITYDSLPSDNILQSQYHGVPDKYSFVFQATGVDRETGEQTTDYFFMHRDTLDTRANMENDAYDWMSEEADKYNFDIEIPSLVEGYINPVWG